MAIHLFDGNNVMLRDLDSATHQRLSLRQRWAAANQRDLHIWVWDGANHNARRRELVPEYKANRTPMAEDRFAQIGVFRECLAHSNAWQIECRGWEADDVIATLVKAMPGPKVVHTNDLDYAQLLTMNDVHLNGVKKLPTTLLPEHVPLFKATVGDPADNIKGIPLFGPKTWDSMDGLHDRMEEAIDTLDVAALKAMPFKPGQRAWIVENIDKLHAMLTITRFYTVPPAELDLGITRGAQNFAAMDALLRRFFL